MSFLLAMIMASVTLASDNGMTEAEAFYEGVSGTFNTGQPLAWNFVIGGIEESKVSKVLSDVSKAGFPSVEVPDDEDEQGLFSVWCSETRVHTKESFASRVSELKRIAASHDASISDYSAGVGDAL